MQTADGIIVSPSRPPRSGRHRLAASPVPIVTCDEPADSLLIAGSVRSDNFGGGRAAAHHLVDAGGTRFGLVGGHGYLPYGWDLVVVALVGAAFYFWGLKCGWRTPDVEQNSAEAARG